jgi:hypothetical protein
MENVIHLILGIFLAVIAGLKLEKAEKTNSWLVFAVFLIFFIGGFCAFLLIK